MESHPVIKLAKQLFGEAAETIPFQRTVYDSIAAGKNVVLQAPTGAGKTFAALAPFVLGQWGAGTGAPARKLIYSLPLRVLAGSLKEQYEEDVPVQIDGVQLRFTNQYSGASNDRFLDGGDGYWLPENRKVTPGTRHAIFTTIDQTLSGFIGTPLGASPRQANMLYGSVLSGALVFDEFHLLEPEKSLQTALHLLRKSPWPVLIMTATMSKTLRRELCSILDAEEVIVGDEDLPHIHSQYETVKQIEVEKHLMDGAELADRLGKRTLVICNRVARAQGVFEALDQALKERGDDRKRMLLHSRFLPEDRAEKEELLRAWFGKTSTAPALLVATQVVEAGLDISCEVMHAEISPIDSFLQRIGRSARFEGERGAEIHVYPLESMDEPGAFLPYRKETTLLTLRHLREQENLRFRDTQELIDDILTEEHREIIQTYRSGEAIRAREIERVRKEGDYAANKTLVRFIDNVEIVVAVPRAMEEGDASPFAYPAVSVPVGTFRGYLHGEDGIAHVVEEFTDEAGQQPGGKYFTVMPLDPREKKWPSRRFVIPPSHAAYDAALGLRLEVPGERTFAPDEEVANWFSYDYEKEEYKEHIRRLYEQHELRQASLDALRRLSASEQHLYIAVRNPARVVDLVIWGHDLAKLSDGWQAAHGDEDLPLAHGGRTNSPPPHAGESARAVAAAIPALLPEEDRSTQAQVVRAIRTHHSPRATAFTAYRIGPERRGYLRRVTPELTATLAEDIGAAWDRIAWNQPTGNERPRWPDRDLGPESEPVYALLAYILRRSDQLATSEVSSAKEKERPPPTTGVSNFL